jgi:hypothetical protein
MIFTGSCINCNQKTAQICAVCARNESQQVQFCCKKRECRVSENFKSHLAFHEIEGKRTGQLESGAKPKRKRRMEGPSSSSSSEESSSDYGGTTYSSDSDSEEDVLVKKFIQAEEIFEDPISMEFWNSKFFVGLRLAMQDSFHSMNVHDWLQKWYSHSNAVMFFILGLAVSQFWVLVRNDQTGRCFAFHSRCKTRSYRLQICGSPNWSGRLPKIEEMRQVHGSRTQGHQNSHSVHQSRRSTQVLHFLQHHHCC